MASPSKAKLQELLADLNSAANSYNSSDDLDGTKSRATIREKAKKLTRAMTTPDEMSWYQCLNMTELIALRLCIKVNVFENIPAQGSISGKDLAEATSTNQSLLERMLRIMVATGFLEQTRPDGGNYEHTKFSKAYINTTTPGPGTFFKAMYDEYFKTNYNFDEYLEARFSPPYPEPASNTHNSYNWRHGKEGQSTWVTMASFPERMATFQMGLAALDSSVPAVGSFYDFGQLVSDEPDRIELVDVGGGHGRVLKAILDATPTLDVKKCVLQDQPNVLEGAREKKTAPEGVRMMAIDFHTEQPVKGAKAYYMRFISHDYGDEAAINILTQVAKAMAPDSRILIGDQVIPERAGEADVSAAILDQMMLCIGGKERTEAGFKFLLENSGLELFKVHRVEGTAGALVEARLKH